eukprot:TRINITY_DN1006_c0_g1_i2.p1 TRINITY_DN1006_c0_g1~~TRINITY_DN1006_c0_g1_i2.p1  ORF type:complete len:653 (-),score=78.34 TRINITY_DN1006_c0_g1_i2:705-2663(-)
MAAYADNVQLIRQLNAQHHSATFGEGPFTDLTAEEFAHKYLTGLLEPHSQPSNVVREIDTRAIAVRPPLTTIFDPTQTPPSFNWCDYGACNPVADQGMCGGCWAFAAVAAVESQYQIATGTLLKLSEQQLLDCIDGGIGCCGGWPYEAFAEQHKFYQEADYPFLDIAISTACNAAPHGCPSHLEPAVTTYGYEAVVLSPPAVASFVYKNGPLATGIYVSDNLQHYVGGILDDPSCRAFSPYMNHAVAVVGFGESESHRKYFTVRNSWSASWGENGYFRIAMDNPCGIGATNNNYNPVAARPFVLQPNATPPGWICDATRFDDGDSCDCECGSYDIDCDEWALATTAAGCTISPTANMFCNFNGKCVDIPATWHCYPGHYGAEDGCHCSCAFKRDCKLSDQTVWSCDPTQVCNKNGACEYVVPFSWACDPRSYGGSDGCDCKCGAWDPDCDDCEQMTVEKTHNCAANSVCVWPGECVGISAWTCERCYYASWDGCDCACGMWDPDCELQGDTPYNCYSNQTCGYDGSCIQVPDAWQCEHSEYYSHDGCSCDCGTYDPDCADHSQPVIYCESGSTCSSAGSCKVPGKCGTRCPSDYLGDGECDVDCLTAACNFDDEDCGLPGNDRESSNEAKRLLAPCLLSLGLLALHLYEKVL